MGAQQRRATERDHKHHGPKELSPTKPNNEFLMKTNHVQQHIKSKRAAAAAPRNAIQECNFAISDYSSLFWPARSSSAFTAATSVPSAFHRVSVLFATESHLSMAVRASAVGDASAPSTIISKPVSAAATL